MLCMALAAHLREGSGQVFSLYLREGSGQVFSLYLREGSGQVFSLYLREGSGSGVQLVAIYGTSLCQHVVILYCLFCVYLSKKNSAQVSLIWYRSVRRNGNDISIF